MKRILLLGTGGTIASAPFAEGLAPDMSGSALLELVPEIANYCAVDCVQLFNIDSTNMRPEHWLKLAAVIRDKYFDYDGFVITHGTDTMAYTAAALSYIVQFSQKPIVLTGSQVPLTSANTDAGRNLTDAFIYACDPQSCGVVIVFSGSVITGTRARKNYSMRFSAFGSVNYPEIARIQGGRITRYIPMGFSEPVTFAQSVDENVGLIKLVPGMRNDVLSYITNLYDGIVVESFGVGGIPEYSDFYRVLSSAVEAGKLIVMTTQVPNEGSDLSVYKVGRVLKDGLKVLEAYDMTTEAAFTKLMWILGRTHDFNEAEKLFYKPVQNDIMLSGR